LTAKRSSGARSGGGPRPGARSAAVKLKSKKKRKPSSQRWLERQLNDPYVEAARAAGYRSRAAYKLAELDDRFHILKPGQAVIDLGAAPGGWTQVIVARTRAPASGAKVVALDILDTDPIPGAEILKLDFMADEAPERLRAALGRAADVVVSDMAPATMGHAQTDHLRIVTLVEASYEFAREVLAPGGAFVAKVFQGGTESTLLQRMKADFTEVKHAKPPASRAESAEVYVVATGFRG
jgi:23S rRNA (uridine2552-2'-O)-methyltransferase